MNLSPRQKQVLVGVAAGDPEKTIADRLGISDKTVHSHKDRIKRKLGMTNIPMVAVVLEAHRMKLIPKPPRNYKLPLGTRLMMTTRMCDALAGCSCQKWYNREILRLL